MYITNITIRDLRSFGGSHELGLNRPDGTYAGWTVFAGRNGAGKSTLLKAIALSVVGPKIGLSIAGVFSGWVRNGEEKAEVGTRLSFEAGLDAFKTSGPGKEGEFWTGIRWTSTPTSTDSIEASAGRHFRPGRNNRTRGPWNEAPKGWFIAGYGPYRHLGPTTVGVLRLSKNPVAARLVNLFNEAASLSEAVDWLKGVHLRALEGRSGAQRLRDDVLALLADGLLPDGSCVTKVDSEGLWIERDGVELTLEHVSDGYRTVSGLVVDIAQRLHETYGSLELTRNGDGTLVCNQPGVVLIDENDAHLHVAWQQKIGFWLTSRFPKIQFLVTTHSPFICQAASPKGLIRLPGPGDASKMAHVSDATFKFVVNGGADDAVMSDIFGLDHAISAPAHLKKNEIAALEGRVLSGSASPTEMARYESLRDELPTDLGELAERRLRAVVGSGH